MPNPKIKTKLPAARIKRIMRLDEEVGKVSQATPVLIAKALECFLEALVKAVAAEAQAKDAKRVTVQHLKEAITNEPKFDFLLDLVKDLPEFGEDVDKPKRKRKSKKEKDDEMEVAAE